MLGFRYMRANPTTYVFHYRRGAVRRAGLGLSFFYHSPTSVLVAVPVSSVDVPFVFNEVSADFQAVSLQGQLTYRITEPERIAGLLDFSIHPGGGYVSDDPQKLNERIVNATQVLASAVTRRMRLRELLTAPLDGIVAEVLGGVKQSEAVTMLGLEVLGLSILAIKPTPETSKALEAEARELLLRQADQAVYERRNAAVEQERRIKESELNTEIAVEEKRRQIRETQMAADIAVEQQRSTLLDRQVENDRKEAEAKGFALEATLKPLRETDWRTLMAANAAQIDPRLSIAMAFRDLADNAGKIGQVNISPELLSALLQAPAAPAPPAPSQQVRKPKR
jgi:regulator of protease activity HflC (stomatin/prohibitin superfamily)